MYCVNCGVKLADSERVCPLCGTKAYHPDIKQPEAEGPYPTDKALPETVNPKGILFVLTVIFAQPIFITLFCDLQFNAAVTWSGYAAGGVLLGYILFVLPFWFKRPNPVIFAPVDFAASALYMLYVDLATGGGWYLTFALPITVYFALLVTTYVTLTRYVKRGILYIIGGTWIGLGVFFPLIEILIGVTFLDKISIVWSPYPCSVCVIFGLMFIVIAIVKPLKESLRKRFFI